MPFIERDGARVHWRLDGHPDRPALVLANSLGTDMALWAPVLPPLLKHFRVLRVDKRGHGASEASPGDYSIELLARDVLAAMDAGSVDKAHFCGVSIGGMIGIWLGANAGERFESLVLSNTAAKAVPGAATARTTIPFSTSPANRPKPEPMKWSPTSWTISGLRRSGLSLPYFNSASL